MLSPRRLPRRKTATAKGLPGRRRLHGLEPGAAPSLTRVTAVRHDSTYSDDATGDEAYELSRTGPATRKEACVSKDRWTRRQIERLAKDLHDFVLEKEAFIANAEDKAIIEIFLTGGRPDFRLTTSTR